MGSTGGTFLNGQRVRRPETLKQDDEITMGDGTLLIFITDPEHPALKRSASTGHHTTIHDSRGMR
jgi:pSer/pThr/pTyr-binding forkhead associated (FHA) protein